VTYVGENSGQFDYILLVSLEILTFEIYVYVSNDSNRFARAISLGSFI